MPLLEFFEEIEVVGRQLPRGGTWDVVPETPPHSVGHHSAPSLLRPTQAVCRNPIPVTWFGPTQLFHGNTFLFPDSRTVQKMDLFLQPDPPQRAHNM